MKSKKNILFETNTIIDEHEFKKFQKFYLNKFKKSFFPKLIIILLALLSIVLNWYKKDYYLVILVVLFLVIYPIILNITLDRQIKRMYMTNKKINMLDEKIVFFNDFFESKSSINYCKVKYDDVFVVVETKTNFYIFLSDNQAFILIKNNIDDILKFRNFIRTRVDLKTYR